MSGGLRLMVCGAVRVWLQPGTATRVAPGGYPRNACLTENAWAWDTDKPNCVYTLSLGSAYTIVLRNDSCRVGVAHVSIDGKSVARVRLEAHVTECVSSYWIGGPELVGKALTLHHESSVAALDSGAVAGSSVNGKVEIALEMEKFERLHSPLSFASHVDPEYRRALASGPRNVDLTPHYRRSVVWSDCRSMDMGEVVRRSTTRPMEFTPISAPAATSAAAPEFKVIAPCNASATAAGVPVEANVSAPPELMPGQLRAVTAPGRDTGLRLVSHSYDLRDVERHTLVFWIRASPAL